MSTPGPGRPTKYRRIYDEQVRKLCLLNAINPQIADFFEVTVSTIKLWKKKHKGFSAAIKAGKAQADAEVADSLFNRACGYSCKETKVFCEKGNITTATITRHYPPDTAAAFIWLKNRAGWSDRPKEVAAPTGYATMSPAEAAAHMDSATSPSDNKQSGDAR